MRYRDLQSAFGLMSTLDTVGRVLFSLVALLATLRVSVGVYAWHATNKLERPAYTVVRTLSDGVELRAGCSEGGTISSEGGTTSSEGGTTSSEGGTTRSEGGTRR